MSRRAGVGPLLTSLTCDSPGITPVRPPAGRPMGLWHAGVDGFRDALDVGRVGLAAGAPPVPCHSGGSRLRRPPGVVNPHPLQAASAERRGSVSGGAVCCAPDGTGGVSRSRPDVTGADQPRSRGGIRRAEQRSRTFYQPVRWEPKTLSSMGARSKRQCRTLRHSPVQERAPSNPQTPMDPEVLSPAWAWRDPPQPHVTSPRSVHVMQYVRML